ncbi:MAG TPA: transcription antitermination factor NusB [Deltaproteobacteria bacterium]|nr:transcription antitermination factor NusB [Deltaproteobacteria bacterium]
MGNRRKAREVSLQLLYETELAHKSGREVTERFLKDPHGLQFETGELDADALQEVKDFTRLILEGVANNVREIDSLMESHSTHWKVSRMASVDRNILRMAIFELLYCSDIPASVTINEAIEIAKKYGTEESGAFVNGILDHIAKALKKI